MADVPAPNRWRPAWSAVLVLRLPSEEALWLSGIAVEAGLLGLEVTMTEADHRETLAELKRRHPGVQVGIGSIRDAADIPPAADVGADFAVTPALVRGATAAAHDVGLPLIQGAATPTEIYSAWREGSDIVKVFPASHLGGPGYVKSVLAPMPELSLMASGGVGPANAGEYLAAGAASVAIGSSIGPAGALAARDTDAIRDALAHLRVP